ncbi:MAG: ribosome-associated translation inhibitor RaiA [Candidatus Nealsonbacteria bacterium DGGOD1a]|jgi:ribosomal subunit interface protein|nr:MAG: ribosome-associated translation inhibitor RaiA [Candidatus Nealsonbacteria bacterium DGGOD1a]
MNIIVKTKNIEMTPSLREFVEEKIGSLEKYFDLLQEVDDPSLVSKIEAVVEVGRTTLHHRKGDICRAEVLITFHRNKLRAAKSADDLEKAVVAVRDDLQRQITDFKEKMLDKARK